MAVTGSAVVERLYSKPYFGDPEKWCYRELAFVERLNI